MKAFKFSLSEYDNTISDYPKVRAYLHEEHWKLGNRVYPAIVVLPGGGYSSTSEREAEPVGIKFFGEGFNVFILDYTVKDYGKVFPNALRECACLIALIRKNAKEWLCDENKVSVIGFSAGGHLASSIATRFSDPVLGEYKDIARPNLAVLAYPVILSGKYAHLGSFVSLTGTEDEEEHKIHDTNSYVTENTPPVFIFHTADDDVVPVQNTLVFAKALADNKVKFECHVYESGVHGLSLANEVTKTTTEHDNQVNPRVEEWFRDCLRFMKANGMTIELKK